MADFHLTNHFFDGNVASGQEVSQQSLDVRTTQQRMTLSNGKLLLPRRTGASQFRTHRSSTSQFRAANFGQFRTHQFWTIRSHELFAPWAHIGIGTAGVFETAALSLRDGSTRNWIFWCTVRGAHVGLSDHQTQIHWEPARADSLETCVRIGKAIRRA